MTHPQKGYHRLFLSSKTRETNIAWLPENDNFKPFCYFADQWNAFADFWASFICYDEGTRQWGLNPALRISALLI